VGAIEALVVLWEERKAFLRDEELRQRFERARGAANQAVAGAISTVMAATGYNDGGAADDGTVCMEAGEMREIARLAGLSPNLEELDPVAYVDRSGMMRLPADLAERLARAYASAQPESVLLFIEDEETQLRTEGNMPGERWAHDYLREKMPGFALARYWAGHEEEVARLRLEIERLRSLVWTAADELMRAGAEREGKRIRRALERG
jgi:hypothetical protein